MKRPKARSVRKRIVLAVSLLLTAALTAAGVVMYLTFVRAPANTPADACTDGRDGPSGPVVVAAGASMAQGTLGADWVSALRDMPMQDGHEVVNAGKNGNTSADLLKRVDSDIVACRPDAVTVLVGTNDVKDGVPLAEYRKNIRAIVDRIESRTDARIALMSLPPLGEDLTTDINQKLKSYNAAIKETAAAHAGVDYLPVNEKMTEHLRKAGGDGAAYDFSFLKSFGVAAQHYLFGISWDAVASGGGHDLLVDDIHLSDRGGAIITGLAAEWLQ